MRELDFSEVFYNHHLFYPALKMVVYHQLYVSRLPTLKLRNIMQLYIEGLNSIHCIITIYINCIVTIFIVSLQYSYIVCYNIHSLHVYHYNIHYITLYDYCIITICMQLCIVLLQMLPDYRKGSADIRTYRG